ncbi:MAG TPA: TldD/PmbA family protein, partial [Thermopetrobacter sp.]|nr:TldD/PmbA family protein [Thermopetrobacter sp.]
EAALAVKGVRQSMGASASASRSLTYLAASNGFAGGYAETGYGVSAAVIAGEGADMQRDYDYDSQAHLADLCAPEEVGREAGERTVRRLNPHKPESMADAPVIFEQRLAGSLAGHLAAAVNGRAVARGGSFLKDKMGRRIMPDTVQVIDDPLMPRGHGSAPFDGEGLPTRRIDVVQDGALSAWLLDLATARQLGMESNGCAARGVGSPPSPSSSNFFIANGAATPQELIGSVKRGLLVTELIGMGVNIVNGDYSRGASGFLIENGEITRPVSELTIAGNLADMFRRFTPANDLVFRGARAAPTLLIEGMTIAGR